MLYSPTGESHWVSLGSSYLFLNGEVGRVAERPEESTPFSVVANRGVLDELVLKVGNCLALYEDLRYTEDGMYPDVIMGALKSRLEVSYGRRLILSLCQRKNRQDYEKNCTELMNELRNTNENV